MSIESTKMCAAHSEDYKIPPNIICLPDTSYARDLQAQGACALRFFLIECVFYWSIMRWQWNLVKNTLKSFFFIRYVTLKRLRFKLLAVINKHIVKFFKWEKRYSQKFVWQLTRYNEIVISRELLNVEEKLKNSHLPSLAYPLKTRG